jgi:cyclopropane-fatty-acyl-phospholipid synthase
MQEQHGHSSGAAIAIDAASVEQLTAGLDSASRRALTLACRLEKGVLDIEMPDGRLYRVTGREPGPSGHIKIHDLAFARRIITEGDLGLAESNLRGEWESRNLQNFMLLFCENHHIVDRLLEGQPLIRMWHRLRHWLNRNTRSGSRRNIHAHYDIGNRFYSSWLDRTMTYSSAIFETGDNDLSSAQQRKYRALAEATGIRQGDHVLEIGCGWGGFAEFAAKELGCRVTGLTISQEQHDFAKQRMAAAGLGERVTIKLQDYRDERGVYDRIASIEMFEAVGESYWPTYFQQLRDRLKPGGAAGLQVITIRDDQFASYRRDVDFIQKYVFPGGMLPSPRVLRQFGERFGLALTAERIFGHDYAETLAQWRVRFRSAWPQLTTMGFDERFRRLWEYYLAYCEAGFRSGNIDVRQIVYARPA